MGQKITIYGTNVHPGETANLALPLPEQYSCAPLYMPIKVINGVQPGPCMLIFSVLKGTELNGLEIANRIIQMIDPKKLAGTIIAIPVMNVYGLTHYPAVLPNGSDLTNCFPGNEEGSYGERIAHMVTQEALKKADYCIELQTGGVNHNILPQVYCNFENAKAKSLAKVFCPPVVTNVVLERNCLRQTSEDLQVPLLVYQAGEALRFDENAIDLGVSGIKNIMKHLNMLDQNPEMKTTPIFSKDEEWIAAHKAGILHALVTLGQTIEKGQLIANINDPFGPDVVEPIYSNQNGVVVGINTSPLIHEGLPIFKIASFLDDEKAETVIGQWDKSQPDSFIGS